MNTKPALSAKCVERLTILADYMDSLDDPKFTMAEVAHECGSPACAWGHAKLVVFKGIVEKHATLISGSKVFFDLPDTEMIGHLFGGLSLGIKTPQQWAAHCRAFLAEHGVENPPIVNPIKRDEFKAFMQTVLAPVEVS